MEGWELGGVSRCPCGPWLMTQEAVGMGNVSVPVLLAGLVAVGEKAQKRSGHYVVMKDLSGEILVWSNAVPRGWVGPDPGMSVCQGSTRCLR